jgi:crotonobetainyl-CoA:carnitine CoA-transferase CaiB-like acyl-CoA transferase
VKVTFDDRDIPVVASPLHFSESGTGFWRSPPQLGEHSDQILTLTELGYGEAEVTSLRTSGAVA